MTTPTEPTARPALLQAILGNAVSMTASPGDLEQCRTYIESIERDAARYRWWRDPPTSCNHMIDLTGTDLDTAIDTAMQEVKRD